MPMYDLNNFELFVCKEIMGSWTMCLTGIIERGWAYLDKQEHNLYNYNQLQYSHISPSAKRIPFFVL